MKKLGYDNWWDKLMGRTSGLTRDEKNEDWFGLTKIEWKIIYSMVSLYCFWIITKIILTILKLF